MDIRTDSTEFVNSAITTDFDIEASTISVALPEAGEVPTTWYTAEIVSSDQTSVEPARWKTYFRLLVGPSGVVTLPVGVYDFTVRLNHVTEIPIRKAGILQVTLT